MSTPTPIAVISDVHSNFEALAAVLEDLKDLGETRLVCLGDIVGYASGVRACLREVRALGCHVLKGNHDEAACLPHPPDDFNATARAGIIFASARLTDDDRDWLAALPMRLYLDGHAFTHASLSGLFRWEYVSSTEDAMRHFANQTSRLAFCGHTHRPAVWWQEPRGKQISICSGEGVVPLPKGGKLLINAGSVGQPRDGDNRACYVIYRPDEDCVEFRRVAYDIARTRKKIIRAKLPRFTAQRLTQGK